MDVFAEINSLSESTIATKLALEEALDGKSYICPLCGHGRHGNGFKQKYNSHFGRLNWWCHTCTRNYSNCDLIAVVEEINPLDAKTLAARLREMFPEYDETPARVGSEEEVKPPLTVDTPFSSSRDKGAAVVTQSKLIKPARNFESFYKRCWINYSLKEFVTKCGGKWRGLTYETLKSAHCMFNPEYTPEEGLKVPAVIVPYDDELYYWRRVDEVPEGELKGGVPKDTTRKPYIAAPIVLDLPNFIVEGEIDSLSILQVFKRFDVGIIATGGAQFYRQTVSEIERQFGQSEVKPRFIVLFDNDAKGLRYGEIMTSALQAAKFPAEQKFFESRPEGKYLRWDTKTRSESVFYQPKVDANDCLQRGEMFLVERLVDVIIETEDLLATQDTIFKGDKNHGRK